ncbi:MAG: methionyl-tRNA formyltransferase [Candidatus Altimarinota bacterium]
MPTILFLGTPQFAVPILEELHQHFQIIGVVTQPDRPVGRKLVLTPPPVKTKALELGLNVYQPEQAAEIADMAHESFDFLITAAYGEYLPSKVLQLPTKDALNVHPSLLPQYRGATPMQSALLNGDQKTGVSIIRMVKEMDAGELFAQHELDINPEWKYPELEQACSQLGAELMTEVISKYDSITPVPQSTDHITHCTKITKEMGKIDFTQETAQQIHNKLRAFTPWPGVYTLFKDQKLSLLEFTTNYHLQPTNSPGEIFRQDNHILIVCKEGSITLQKVQLAGKNPTDIKSFLNGHPDFIGTQLHKR